MRLSRCFSVVSLVLVSALVSGCALPLMVGGVAALSGVAVNTDRRSAGTQLEDQTIEFKAGNRVRSLLVGKEYRLNFTAYNGVVLITGELPSPDLQLLVTDWVSTIEHVRSVVNESMVSAPSPVNERSQDLVLSGKVRTAWLGTRDLNSNAFKLTTERGVVYVMGLATEAETHAAVSMARAVEGVRKVVQIVEILSVDDVINMRAAAAGPVSAK